MRRCAVPVGNGVKFSARDDCNRADERHQQQHSRRFDRNEVAAEEFGPEAGHMIVLQRIKSSRGSCCQRFNCASAARERAGRKPADGECQQSQQDSPRHGRQQRFAGNPVVGR